MKIKKIKCPYCSLEANSKSGLTKHINMMHLILSHSQVRQAQKDIENLSKNK